MTTENADADADALSALLQALAHEPPMGVIIEALQKQGHERHAHGLQLFIDRINSVIEEHGLTDKYLAHRTQLKGC